MVNLVKLHFNIMCYVHDECVDDLGHDLAMWLKEEWFNGEDMIDVEYVDYEIIN